MLRLTSKSVFDRLAVTGMSLIAITLLLGAAALEAKPLTDCPLRDEPYSIDSPLMDILLKPEAAAVANRHMGDVLEKLPSSFASSEAPSFSAILTLRNIASMAGLPPESLAPIEDELAGLEITQSDKVARCARYDTDVPDIRFPAGAPRLLLFQKITGFRDVPSVEAATAALRAMAERNGWALVETENGAALTPGILEQVDAVIWNNISGDVLTLSQRQAFQDYINNGGGYVGIHGSAGDPNYFWDWYVEDLIGARFIGHPMDPQFQDARIVVENPTDGIGEGIPASWEMNDEWYSFKASPRIKGATVVAALDESSYSPVGRGGQDLRMGDHPIAWTLRINKGRSFYSAIGHRPEVYAEPNHVRLLEQGITWAAGENVTD